MEMPWKSHKALLVVLLREEDCTKNIGNTTWQCGAASESASLTLNPLFTFDPFFYTSYDVR